MDNGDIAATILSILALVVSAVTLYFTYLQKKAALVGCLAAVKAPEPGQIENCVFDFALSNAGNLELLIRDVSLYFDDPEAELVPEIRALLPVVLKPGQVHLLTVEIPNRFLESVARRRRVLNIRFDIFSSRGILYGPHKAIEPIGEVSELSKDAWAPFSLGAAEF